MTPETDIATRAIFLLRARARADGARFEYRAEPCIYLNGKSRPPVKPDIAIRIFPDPDDDRWFEYVIVEVKQRMCEELVAQCERWSGLCHTVIAAWEEGGRVRLKESRRCELPDIHHVHEAFNRQPEGFPVEAGSAGVKRCTPKRSKWWRYARPIVQESGGSIDAKQLRRELRKRGDMKPVPTVDAIRKAIDRGQWLEATYEDHGTSTTVIVEDDNGL